MTVNRDDVAEYLDLQFSALATAIGQDSDPLTGYESDINMAFRKLGVTRADLATATVEDDQEESVFALAEYAAARRFWRQLSARVNTSIGGNSFTFTHLLANAALLMEDAADTCAALGIDVVGGWSVGYMTTDEFEPPLEWA